MRKQILILLFTIITLSSAKFFLSDSLTEEVIKVGVERSKTTPLMVGSYNRNLLDNVPLEEQLLPTEVHESQSNEIRCAVFGGQNVMVYFNGQNFWRINTVSPEANNPTSDQICREISKDPTLASTKFDKLFIGEQPPYYAFYLNDAWQTDGNAELDQAYQAVYCNNVGYIYCQPL